jgi:hypothetical protein
MHQQTRTRQLLFRISSLALVTILLVACSTGGDKTDETPTPEPTAAPPTAAPGELSVGEVLDRVNTAWSGVESMRVTTFSGTATQTDTGTAVPSGSYTVEEWTSPGNRRVAEIFNGTAINEQIYVDGTIYMRGTFVTMAVAPEVGPETWIILDESVVPPDTPVGLRITYLTRESGSPFAGMSPDLLAQPANESGTVRVGDRSCTLYTFGDQGNEGDEIRYELALDENDLPCQVVLRGGDAQNSSVYEFNSDDIRIDAPLEGTPVSGTPEG